MSRHEALRAESDNAVHTHRGLDPQDLYRQKRTSALRRLCLVLPSHSECTGRFEVIHHSTGRRFLLSSVFLRSGRADAHTCLLRGC